MNLSSHPLREEGMQESGPCNPTGRVSVSHGSVPDSDPGLSGHLASPADSSIVYHHAGSSSPDSSLPIPPPPQAPPPDESPSEILDANLRARGLQMVETGGRGLCFFTSVIASIQHAAFLSAGSLVSYFRLKEGALLFGRKFTRRSCCLRMTSDFGTALMIRPGQDMLEVFVIRRTVTNGDLSRQLWRRSKIASAAEHGPRYQAAVWRCARDQDKDAERTRVRCRDWVRVERAEAVTECRERPRVRPSPRAPDLLRWTGARTVALHVVAARQTFRRQIQSGRDAPHLPDRE